MKTNVWEVKELLPEEDRRLTGYHEGPTSEYAGSIHHGNQMSGYGYY